VAWHAARCPHVTGVRSPPNVAFSCWRGLASLVKTRQRLYQRKVQARANPLQREVRRRCRELFLLAGVTAGSKAVGRTRPSTSLRLRTQEIW